MPLPTESTTFTRDVLGRYVCNTFDEALVTIDPNARAAAGLPARGDLRPFDFIIIGGGTFGAALAEHLWFRSRGRSERILVLDGGPFLLPEHVQNLPVLGLNAGAARKDHQPQNEVWGLAWNSSDPVGFPGLAYCVGGRSVFWGGFSRFGRTLIAQQDGKGIGLLFYKPQPFENFILRLDFLLPHPRGNNNDNSGVFVRFRDPRLPDPAPDPIDPSNNAAFVAVHTGFEIQIDEQARGDTRFGESDGNFFSRTGAIYKIKSSGTGPGQQDYKNIQNLAAERWHSYEIEVNNQDYIVRLNGQEATRFRRSATDTLRGNPPSVDANSGFIGLQTHTGNIGFANARIKTT